MLTYLQGVVASDNAPSEMDALYSDKLMDAGRKDEAVRAMFIAWKKFPFKHTQQLLALSPEHGAVVQQYARSAPMNSWVAMDIMGQVGHSLWKAGKVAEAQACYEEAYRRDPKNGKQWQRCADACRNGKSPL